MALDKEILRQSFEAIKPVASDVVSKFYETLFAKYPQSVTLFRPERMEGQKQALLGGLVAIFESLDDPERLTGYLSSLGKRHVGYGVRTEHYDWVAESLIETLKFFFADTWTDRLEEAWMVALGFIAETMRSGAESGRADAPDRRSLEMKERIEAAIRDAMKASLRDLSADAELQAAARAAASELLKKALEEGLADLKNQFVERKVA